MNCRKVSHLLSAYMDGELPGVEHRQIHEHLNDCPDCAGEYESLLQTKRMLASMRLREPRADLPTRILEKVHAHPAPQPLWAFWMERAEQWLNASAYKPKYLVATTGLAAVGILFASILIDRSEAIQFHPETPSSVAGLQPAPLTDPSLSRTPSMINVSIGPDDTNTNSRPAPVDPRYYNMNPYSPVPFGSPFGRDIRRVGAH